MYCLIMDENGPEIWACQEGAQFDEATTRSSDHGMAITAARACSTRIGDSFLTSRNDPKTTMKTASV
jgi:hypothetical protein